VPVWSEDRGSEGAEEGGVRGGGVPLPAEGRVWGGGCAPPQKIFDYFVLKWRILMDISGILTYLFWSSALQRKAEYMYINTKQRTQGDAYVNTATSVVSATVYKTKLSRLDFLANALSTSSGVGQCSRWHCSKRSASSRSSVMVERIDVSVRCNLEKTRRDDVV